MKILQPSWHRHNILTAVFLLNLSFRDIYSTHTTGVESSDSPLPDLKRMFRWFTCCDKSCVHSGPILWLSEDICSYLPTVLRLWYRTAVLNRRFLVSCYSVRSVTRHPLCTHWFWGTNAGRDTAAVQDLRDSLAVVVVNTTARQLHSIDQADGTSHCHADTCHLATQWPPLSFCSSHTKLGNCWTLSDCQSTAPASESQGLHDSHALNPCHMYRYLRWSI